MSFAPVAVPSLESPRVLPRVFGRYKLFDFIGKGGMAEIYLARAETALGAARLCVVKQIVAEFSTHPEFAEMLIHEAKLAAHLSHTNIVQVFDLGREEDQLFIAMEYVEGMDLNALLRRCSQTKTALPAQFALGIVCEMLQGLDYAHRARDAEGKPLGIVHRDVSPSNVLISLEGEVKLCDFGIAHANDVVETKGPRLDEAIKGKAGYMSPEHARGEPIDARADVFAAGIVLWELLSGRRLYKNEPGRPLLLEQARRAEIPPVPDKGLADEARLRAIVARALAPSRDERYPSAGAVLRDIEDYMLHAKMAPSALKLGEWIVDRFGSITINQRRARERIVSDRPPALEPVATSSAPSVPAAPAAPAPAPVEMPPHIPTPPSMRLPPVIPGTLDLGPPSNAQLPADPPSSKRLASTKRSPGPIALGVLVALVILAIALYVLAHSN